jgi:hypothetical protein
MIDDTDWIIRTRRQARAHVEALATTPEFHDVRPPASDHGPLARHILEREKIFAELAA